MKSAKISPFTDVLGLYCMSYSPSSILHFCSLPAISGLDNTCLIGWSVMTMIICAWKYLVSCLIACPKASANFSSDPQASASAVYWKSLFFVHFFKVLKNGIDFSADLDRNLFRLANFSFSF
ncbi:hypothetical protein Tco_0160619, partial [Tanacetum coccineum]